MDISEATASVNADIMAELKNNRPTESKSNEEAPVEKRDYYEETRKSNRKVEGRKLYGARSNLKKAIDGLNARGIKNAYKQAKQQAEYLDAIGDKQRASIVRQQYMEDYFLPAVDAVVRISSKEELLGSKELLSQLDSMTLLEGIKGDGYTQSFVMSMYEDGAAPTMSDGMVREAVKDIVRHCQNDRIASAVGVAKRIKKSIDHGDNIAIPEDYELIQKVAIRG